MIAGVVDIGSNSMRLLLVDSDGERLREVEVTALGSGVDRTGRFNEERVAATLEVLGRYGEIMDRVGVGQRRAVATSATRDAEDGAEFIERAARVLGVVPEVISGTEEAELSYLGATASFDDQLPTVVIDIGGGSTEFVYGAGSVKTSTSIDIGSVRLTDRRLPDRPPTAMQLSDASAHVDAEFSTVELPGTPRTVIGAAGTFTSIAAISLGFDRYDRDAVHGTVLSRADTKELIGELSALTVEETAAIPSLDPKRAPVILAGAVIVDRAAVVARTDIIVVSEYGLLNAVATLLLIEGG